MSKVSLQAGENKRVSIERAEFVLVPVSVAEARIVGDDTATFDGNTLATYVREKSSFIANFSGGSFAKPTAAMLPATSIDYIDFVNGDTATNVLIFRQTEY